MLVYRRLVFDSFGFRDGFPTCVSYAKFSALISCVVSFGKPYRMWHAHSDAPRASHVTQQGEEPVLSRRVLAHVESAWRHVYLGCAREQKRSLRKACGLVMPLQPSLEIQRC